MSGKRKLKIIYDARHIKDIYSGLARYTYSILDALIDSEIYFRLEILLDQNEEYSKNPLYSALLTKVNSRVIITTIDAPLFKFKHHINVSRFVNNSDCDVYFYPHFDLPVFVRKKTVFVIHDLFPLVVKNYILKHSFLKILYFKGIIAFSLRKVNTKCIAVSNATKTDIVNFFGENKSGKISVVYEDSFENVIKNHEGELNKYVVDVLNEKYLLYIGDRRPHKNLKLMIDIFSEIKERFNYQGKFIIAGSEKNFDFNVDKYIEGIDYIKTIGRVSDEELNSLYQNMDALFFLSKYEGFGLPIIEAAKYEKRIITSTSGSCSEVAPANALRINIESPMNNLAQNIYEFLNNDCIIDNTDYLSQFSWKISSEKIFKNIKS